MNTSRWFKELSLRKSDKLVLILYKSFSIASHRQVKGIEKNWLINFQMFLGRFVFFSGISHHRLREEKFLVVKKKAKFEITSKKTTKNEYFCLTR